jgi:hypothetical protein
MRNSLYKWLVGHGRQNPCWESNPGHLHCRLSYHRSYIHFSTETIETEHIWKTYNSYKTLKFLTFQDLWSRHKLTLLVKPWRTLRHCTYLFPVVVMSKNIFGCSHGRTQRCIVSSLTLQHIHFLQLAIILSSGLIATSYTLWQFFSCTAEAHHSSCIILIM